MIYLLDVIGFRKLLLYAFLRPFRGFLLLKDQLFSIYREKKYAGYIYEYKTYNNIRNEDEEYDQRIQNYFKKFGKKVNKYWHYCYANATGILSEKYIPEIVYYEEIEPVLNRADLAPAYDDKNMYNRLFKDVPQPKCILRCMNGVYFDNQYNRIKNSADILGQLKEGVEYIIKPSLDGQGGKGIHKIVLRDKKLFLGEKHVQISELTKLYRRDFIIQEILKQHENLNRVYAKAINTIRVISLRIDDEIKILSSIIRFGNAGAFVDNESSGGLSCGISSDGHLKSYAVGKKLDKYHIHPYTQTPFEGVLIPNFEAVLNLVVNSHSKLHYFDIASWDIAMNEHSEPVLIEMNLMEQGINFHQATNGPLFGDLTDRILESVYGNNHT